MEQSTYTTLSTHFQQCLENKSEKSITDCFDFMADVLNFSSAIITINTIQDESYYPFLKFNHSYTDSWVDTYINHQLPNIDPVSDKSPNSPAPFVWTECYQEKPSTDTQTLIAQVANDFKTKDCITVSIPTSNSSDAATLCSLAGVPPTHHKLTKEVLYLSLPIFSHVLQGVETAKPITLTKKEINVLQWATEGKTAWETGVIMALSEATIKYHLKVIFRKLKVSNKAQAIAFAMTKKMV
ncbi:MAG: LuxR C-terminal-related transcriptional regulator [Gammaproteobacteria bacterium]|nr:LuxR C-terminal-related transcriptional regulator [Gammaproteobacteria bacterium]